MFAEHYLWNAVGNPLETTVTAAHLVMTGAMERHPGLRVVLAHGGGAILSLRGRLRHATSFRPTRARLRESPEDSLRRFPIRHGRARRACLRATSSPRRADHVLLGSDYPFDMGDGRPADTGPGRGPRPGGRGAVLGGNAERLLGLEDAARERATTTADVVVAGAGHNSLITAAYLAARRPRGRRARLAPDPRRRRGVRGAAARATCSTRARPGTR